MIEAYGTGIPRIMELYKDYIVKPEIVVTDTSFTIKFPNKNYGDNGKIVKIKVIPSDTETAIFDLITESK